jgi:peptidyl-prolyl cis-trans isomerase SurA
MTDVLLLTMMKSRALRALWCAAALAVGAPLADAQSRARRWPTYIVAVVNQELVTNAELQARLARIREEAARTKQQLPPRPSCASRCWSS